MARLDLPESGLTPYDLPDDQPGVDTGNVARYYETAKRLNGHSPLPGLLVNPYGTATPVARTPVAITAIEFADAPGTEGPTPMVLAAQFVGDFSAAVGTDPGFGVGINAFTTSGSDSGDGEGLDWMISVLAESSHLNDSTIGNLVGLWAEAAFLGAGANDAHVGGMFSIRVVAPKRKNGATGGDCDVVYGLWLDGVDKSTVGASEGYTIYVADGGQVYISGSAVIAAGVAIGSTFPLLIGDGRASDDNSGNFVFTSTNPNGGNLILTDWIAFGSYDTKRIDSGNLSDPNTIVLAPAGSLYLGPTATWRSNGGSSWTAL